MGSSDPDGCTTTIISYTYARCAYNNNNNKNKKTRDSC